MSVTDYKSNIIYHNYLCRLSYLLGLGSIIPTTTKGNVSIVSMEELKNICSHVSLPTVVVGGINEKAISLFENCHLTGFAIISAITQQENSKQATINSRKIIDEQLKKL